MSYRIFGSFSIFPFSKKIRGTKIVTLSFTHSEIVGFFFTKKRNLRFLLNDTIFFLHFRVVRYVDSRDNFPKKDYSKIPPYFLTKNLFSLNRAEHIFWSRLVIWELFGGFRMMTLKKTFFVEHILTDVLDWKFNV